MARKRPVARDRQVDTHLTSDDLYYWDQGALLKSYEKFGGHLRDGGAWFAVWAPGADAVHVVGDFNEWDPRANPMRRVGHCWETFISGAHAGQRYKYQIQRGSYKADKTDPFAFRIEPAEPKGSSTTGLASILTDLTYPWQDELWMTRDAGPASLHQPISIYEVHLGSWRHKDAFESFTYRELAEPLADYVERLGFTHVELLPVAEHAFYGSWGYQVLGYYAATYRYGTPQDLMYLIDTLHQRGIGVLLDWVPAHFATDPQGLVYFDGTPLFEYDDLKMRHHPDWGTCVFDYGKPSVRNFLLSNALFWFDKYHIDGLRVDAVASMLYRDYSREDWTPNYFGGRENLEAIQLLKETNEAIYSHFPQAITIAEESTAFPKVSAPTYDKGLGFMFKWNMGWMHDLLKFIQEDPVHRKYHHSRLTFSFHYAFSEHYVLPFSHDEMVHGKGSLWQRMPGDDWQKAANMRLLLGHQFGHPGKKLLFMGSEFGQREEWNHDAELNWATLEHPLHGGMTRWVTDLNTMYRMCKALWSDEEENWSWIGEHTDDGTLAYQRSNGPDQLVVVLNLTPVPRSDRRVGVPHEGWWLELLNSDALGYGGSGWGNMGSVEAAPVPWDGYPFSVVLTLPPLSIVFFQKKP